MVRPTQQQQSSDATTPAKERKPELPRCVGRVPTKDGAGVTRCHKGGFHVWVVGSFGRSAQVLCGDCITRTKAKGWKVTYQIEGDQAAAEAQSTLTGEHK